jgi:hypothetical protein
VILFLWILGIHCGESPPPSPTPAGKTILYPHGIQEILGFSATEEFFENTPEAESDRQLLKETGFRLIRTDIAWSVVEQNRGEYRWDRYEERVELLQSLGFRILFILDYGNPLYARNPLKTLEGSYDKTPPDDLRDFARFARLTAQRFSGRVDLYEIWNEPNAWFRFWLSDRGPEPDRYAELVRLASSAIKEVCPGCTVMTGGMVYLDYPPFVPGQNRFFRGMIAKDPEVFSSVDGIGFHSYTLYPPANPPEWSGGFEVSLEDALKGTLEACQCTLPIWITETGWPTHGLSEENQANYGLRSLVLSLSFGVQSWLWFSVRELDPQRVVVPHEAKFAVLHPDGSPKPIFLALKRFLEVAGNATAVTDLRPSLGLEGSGDYAFAFAIPSTSGATDQEKVGIVLWTNGISPSPLPSSLAGKEGIRLVSGKKERVFTFLSEPTWIEIP